MNYSNQALKAIKAIGPQGQTILSTTSPQGKFSLTNDQSKASITAATAISKIQLDDVLKDSLHSSFQNESYYSEVLLEPTGGMKQIIKNKLIFKRMNSLLVVHEQNQDAGLNFWRIIVPDKQEIKEHIVQEMHSTPYSAHPGIQRTIARARKSFFGNEYWGT